MQNLFKKIDDGVKAVFESESYKECLRYMSKFTNYSAGNCILIIIEKNGALPEGDNYKDLDFYEGEFKLDSRDILSFPS
ncbi:hypothetical protein [Ruminococcus flavefaciens]|uniref:hypothetical protein n=1 Tax=Ruminococcus flavefaciens TaxID=1265 RepID=UPI0026F28BC0|nr:hypothetical protein [Ruminococcus flavefaciens]